MLKQVFLFLTFFFLAAGSVIAFMRMSKDKKVRKGKAEFKEKESLKRNLIALALYAAGFVTYLLSKAFS